MNSNWNTAMTGLILHSWEICHQRGGTAKYSIDESQNTPQNRLALLNRWITNRRAVWRQQNPDASPKVRAKRSQSECKKMIN